jgi:REP element-mobilizing transposase RayT
MPHADGHRAAMGRRSRPYVPGGFFHLVSRVHGGRPLFTPPLRSQVVRLIHSSVARTDAQLVAYVVMPNHLHLIVRQGRAELTDTMQPLLRRLAHRVQKEHGIEGRIVERRYRHRMCGNAEHLRHAVVYTHLNPWRAGLCGPASNYRWSSQSAYRAGADPAEYGLDPCLQERVLQLFAAEHRKNREQLCADYMKWIDYRMQRDSELVQGDEDRFDEEPTARPSTLAGDEVWIRYLAGPAAEGAPGHRNLPDLRDYVQIELTRIAPGLTRTQITGSWLPRQLSQVRSEVIRSAAARGYRTVQLARFFNLSPQSVSRLKGGKPRP